MTVPSSCTEREIASISLAAKLKVKPGDLAVWLGAQKTPPPEVFLMAIDLIGERQLEELAKKRITQPSLPSDSVLTTRAESPRCGVLSRTASYNAR